MTVPAKIAATLDRFVHELAYHLPVGREMVHVDAESAKRAQGIFHDRGAKETVIEAHHQWLELHIVDQMPQGEGRILSAGKWHDTVVLIFPPMFFNQVPQQTSTLIPVYNLIAVLLLVVIAHLL